jgi:iron complex transport system substrate-binding protein
VLSLVDPSRVAAVGTVPNNVPDESAKVGTHVKATAESMLSVQPDLVLVPNWMSPDAIGEMRNMQIPVYVYKTPTTVEEAKAVIHEIAGLLHASDEKMIASMDADLKTVEELANKHTGERPVVAFYTQFGLTGGKGSTFDDMTKYLKVTNAAAQLGLGPFDNGTREDLIKANPDIIIIPSVAYTSDGTTPATAEQLYSDPALQGVKAIANRRVFFVDSSQVMTYSQFMTRAMVSMAQNIYSK